MFSNIIIVIIRVAFFTISAKYSKDIFFILYLSILVLPSNTYSLLKYTSFVIITLLYKGI